MEVPRLIITPPGRPAHNSNEYEVDFTCLIAWFHTSYSDPRVPERSGYKRGIDRGQNAIRLPLLWGAKRVHNAVNNDPSPFFPSRGYFILEQGMIKLHPLLRVFLYFSPVRPSHFAETRPSRVEQTT